MKGGKVIGLHASILMLLGLDHKKLTYAMEGRDFRLTDVAGGARWRPGCERSHPTFFSLRGFWIRYD